MKIQAENLFNSYQDIVINNSGIEAENYNNYDVKRGLRNSNGTGVLAGLSKIGEVHGYIVDDGEKIANHGRLFYRGINIYDLVEGFQSDGRFGFEEVCYLLLLGQLPSSKELDKFNEYLVSERDLSDTFIKDIIQNSPSIDIMNKLAQNVLAKYAFDEDPDNTSVYNIIRQSMELIAQLPSILAYTYQAKAHYHGNDSLIIHKPKKEYSTAENILAMIRPTSEFTKLEAEILDLALVIHAEHGGGNNSTFTTRVVTSSGTDTYSAIAAAIGSLKGPKHGGANIKVVGMLNNIKDNVKNWDNQEEIKDYLRKIILKEAYDQSGLIYGLGHAIYTVSDPRAVLLKNKAEELAKIANREDEYNLYKNIEKLAPEVFYEVKGSVKEISANVDFYSGFVYSMLNIPADLYTPLFAIARMPGWCAHRLEEHITGQRIIRPAYKSVVDKSIYKRIADR